MEVLFKKYTYECSITPSSFDERAILPSLDCFSVLVKNQLGIFAWVCFQVLRSVPLIYVSIPPPI